MNKRKEKEEGVRDKSNLKDEGSGQPRVGGIDAVCEVDEAAEPT